MKKFVFLGALTVFFVLSPLYTLEFKLTPFRLNYLVYYHILYKMQGVSMNEFKNVNVISDTGSRLVFEYGGKQYTADLFTGTGVIYVTMPEGMRNRYITQSSFPALILSDLDRR